MFPYISLKQQCLPIVGIALLLGLLGLPACGQSLHCTIDNDCNKNYHCERSTKRCKLSCVHNSQCALNQRCDRVSGRCTNTNQNCKPNTSRTCSNGHIHWVDSCGNVGERAVNCGNFGCSKDSCQLQTCGNGTCDAPSGENCSTCAKDCPCQSNQTCDNATNSCVDAPKDVCGDGKCANSPMEHCGNCQADCACKTGDICQANRCQPPAICQEGQPCQTNNGTGYCLQGKCIEGCRTDRDCQNNQVCKAGKCQQGAPTCKNTTECSQGQACIGGQCTKCNKPEDCGPGYQCNAGVCQVGLIDDNGGKQWANGKAPKSCKEYYNPPVNTLPATKNGVYWLSPTANSRYRTYCLMETNGGGWTLALKTDGRKNTFGYSSSYWTNTATYQPDEPKLNNKEAKLMSFMTVAFTEILIGMRGSIFGSIKYVQVGHSASSLHNLFRNTSTYKRFNQPASSKAWRAMVNQSSLQPNCGAQGINFTAPKEFRSNRYSSVVGQLRIGILGNNENECGSNDSFIGMGSHMFWAKDIVKTGNYAGHSSAPGGIKNTYSLGYLLVR